MREEEIKKIIKENYYAAGFVNNEYFELPKKSDEPVVEIQSNFSSKHLQQWIPILVEALYKEDSLDKGGINSSEIFLSKIYKRIINSEGIDVSYETYNGMIEFITYWSGIEEIELYKMITFSEYKPEYIKEAVKEMLILSKERAEAKKVINSGKYKIILRNDAVKEILNYYIYQSSAEAVYNRISSIKIGEQVQGQNIKGDLINLTLEPKLENSIYSAPYDNDGIILERTVIYDRGKLIKYEGDFKHSYYLNCEATGDIKNVVFSGGSKSISDMKKEPYLELSSFSDFQLDVLTGNFGGEIRLALFFDGKNTKAITGGSINGNINDVQSNMYLSKETQNCEGFVGPKAIEMFDISVAGK